MKTSKKETKKEVKKITEEKYTKEQIVNSKTFINNRDLLNAILEDKSYSKKEINEIIENYKKGKVIKYGTKNKFIGTYEVDV